MNFAEKIINSIVDENGYCGDRGLSVKQFDILSQYLEEGEIISDGYYECKTHDGSISFWHREYVGEIGRFKVILCERKHFQYGFGVVEITPIYSLDEWQEKLDAEKVEKEKLLAIYKGSEWIGEIKERLEFDCKVLKVSEFEGYYGVGTRYEFLDNDGNVYIWFTNSYQEIEEGSNIRIRATIKKHGEFKGCKQNVVNRVNVR